MFKTQSESLFTAREEVIHSLTHGVGVALSLLALVVLVLKALDTGGSLPVVAALVFGLSMVSVYLASTLYHASRQPRAKKRLQTFDHVAIYLLIAGTYTPFALVTLRGTLGWSMLALIWSLALGGTIFELITQGKQMKLALLFYLSMGWVALPFIKPLAEMLAPGGMAFLVAGGLFYTVGAVFYSLRRLPYHHVVWHLFVLAGSAAHFFCILNFVLGADGVGASNG